MITDPLIILSEQKRFYQDLYRTKTEAVEINISINEFLNKLGIPNYLRNKSKRAKEKSRFKNVKMYWTVFKQINLLPTTEFLLNSTNGVGT